MQSSEKVSAATAATESLTEDAQAVLHAQGCFKDKHIVFWLSAHIALLRQKAAQAGAVLEDSITAQTSLVIAAKDTTASEAASHLTALPACLPYKSKKFEGQKLKLPSKISFVVPQYISDCLAQNSLIPTAPYQITLQQIATQDTRTYSQETYKSTGNDSVQRSTAAQGPSEEQHPTSADVTDLTRPQISSTEAVLTPSSKRQKLADEGGPGLQQGAVKDTPSIGTPDKKIGIYLDIDPKQLSFTGGSTGIVWGTGIDRTAECKYTEMDLY